MLRFALFLLALYAVWLTALYLLQERLIFPGTYLREAPRDRRPPDAVALLHETGPDTATEAWLLPAAQGTAQRPAPLLVFLHGNAELIDDWPALLHPYRNLGLNLLLVEYRGYGRSTGAPGQAAIMADTQALIEQAVARPEVDGERVVLHGRSIGGAVAGCLAPLIRPRGLILESAPAELVSMAGRYLAPAALLRHPLRAADALRGLETPALIFHGQRDMTVPISHAHANRAALSNATLYVYPSSHNDLMAEYDDYWPRIETYLTDLGLAGDR